MRTIRLVLLFCWFALFLQAQNLSSDAQISLLTCTPGEELYSKFGHTAIRIYDPQKEMDIVFNYGIFSFYSDHFYMRFIKGETDYRLGVNDTWSFREGYNMCGRKVHEQQLNLTYSEKEAIFEALRINYLPENRVYRYNFVYDNCATRPYELLAKNLNGTLKATNFNTRKDTYRELISYYTGKNSWGKFGISLIFGTDADKEMTPKQRLFLPEQLMDMVSEAKLSQLEESRKLVTTENIAPFIIKKTSWWGSPAFTIIVFALLIGALSFFDVKRKKNSYWIDAILFFLYGLLGTIMCFLSFISIHPLVQHNFNILFLNPLMFIPFVLLCFKKGQKLLENMEIVWGIYYLLAIIIWLFAPQTAHCFIWFIIIHLFRIRMVWYQDKKFIYRKLFKKGKAVMLFLALLLLPTNTIQAQNTPRLVVAIVVDGLHHHNLDMMEKYFDSGGLRTLQKEGTYIPYMYFPHTVNGGIESVATICTGSVPYYHGIAEDFYFNRTDRKIHSILEDANENGIGTETKISARNVLSSTFSDELKITNNGKSKIYAIGIDAAETVILAGHNANAAIWIDNTNMRWAATSYYTEGLSPWADEMNMNGHFLEIASREWQPRYSYDMYLFPSENEIKNKGFEYISNQQKNKNEKEPILKYTPASNALVVELALKIQEKEQLGIDFQPDMLLLQMTSTTPCSTSDIIHSAEQEDMYMRLNQDLGFLMDQLSKRIGKEHLLFVVVGKPQMGMTPEKQKQHKIPTGYFNVNRSAALINTYLMAIYGHERWIDGCYNNRIFLNKLLLEQKKINLAEMQTIVANFLLEFDGIQNAFTSTQLFSLSEDQYNNISQLKNAYNKKSGGDVLFTLQPGWIVSDEKNVPIDRIADINPTVPLFLWGMDITKKKIARPQAATQIAPYLCKILQIAFPNACNTTNESWIE